MPDNLFDRGYRAGPFAGVPVSEWRPRKSPVTVRDLLDLACRNPAVKMCVDAWLAGEFTFEQAMCFLVCELAASNERLSAMAKDKIVTTELKPITVTPQVVEWDPGVRADAPHVAEEPGG